MKAEYPVAIIGAGPYGLSLANHLAYNNTQFIILGKSMDLWRNHTFNSMNLRSDYAASEISHPTGQFRFDRFCRDEAISLDDISGQLPVNIYRAYIDWCQNQFPFEVDEELVTNIHQSSNTFIIKTDQNKTFSAEKVVIATGIAHHLHIPDEFEDHSGIIHSYHTQKIETIRHQKVLVVGAGQSAAESISVLNHNQNSVEWYTRQDPIFFSEPLNIPKWFFNQVIRLPRLIRALNPTIIQKAFSLFSATTITPNFRDLLDKTYRHSQQPRLSQFDKVIMATGYRYHLSEIPFINRSLKNRIHQSKNFPIVSYRFESSVPGLYFLGAITEPFFGPPMKFMIGAHYSSTVLAQVLN